MDNGQAANIATALAAIVAISLALSQALGPFVMYLVEAVKATGWVKDGYSGLLALFVGMVLGGALGGLTDRTADENYSVWTMVGMGAFAGALMAAGAVKTYKAAGDINTAKSFQAGLITAHQGPLPDIVDTSEAEPEGETVGAAQYASTATLLDDYRHLPEPAIL